VKRLSRHVRIVWFSTNWRLESENESAFVLQDDGAPPHFTYKVRHALSAGVPNRSIGRCERITWLRRSPYLTPLDFLMWGYGKNIFYAEKIPDLRHLLEKIYAAVASHTGHASSYLGRNRIPLGYLYGYEPCSHRDLVEMSENFQSFSRYLRKVTYFILFHISGVIVFWIYVVLFLLPCMYEKLDKNGILKQATIIH
jgi:hypothetical protein